MKKWLLLVIGLALLTTTCKKFKYRKNCCTGSLRVHTAGFNNSDTIYIAAPNAFTPNGDGINDVFQLYVSGFDMNSFSLRIYKGNNSNGSVFYAYDPYTPWDGTENGAPLDPGVYVYEFSVYSYTGEIVEGEGELCLIDYDYADGIKNCSSCYFGDQFDPRLGSFPFETSENIGCND